MMAPSFVLPGHGLVPPVNDLEALLDDDALFQIILKRAYRAKVVFDDFLGELCSEIMGALGGNDPSLDRAVRDMILRPPYREKFFTMLAKVARD